MENFVLLAVGALVVGILFRVLAGSMDPGRIRAYVEGQGGQFLSAEWAPFGSGWFGEKNDRIYEVRYVDAAGNERFATCKTGLFSGVYFTEDRIVQPAEPPPEAAGPAAAGPSAPGRSLRRRYPGGAGAVGRFLSGEKAADPSLIAPSPGGRTGDGAPGAGSVAEPDRLAGLERENRELRAEIERLRKRDA